MNRIQLLDCTLRDGGYVNDFRFGESGIRKILSQLTAAKIDIIECGFLENCEYDEDCSIYSSVEQIRELLPTNRGDSMYVAMACYGEYDISQLSDYDGTSIDGVRVSFHHNEVAGAMKFCKAIIDKGYKVFLQPVGTTSYDDAQLLDLIERTNRLNPFAFYLVDTLGLMQKDDVLRYYNTINRNLDEHIRFGFHSHNNLQLSYSNSQLLVDMNPTRTISIDASVNGMGRGAGNLNTELIAHYLNTKERRYDVEPILDIVDEYISKIRSEYFWGYDVPHYLAAINGCHPNYAAYYMNKQTLTIKNIGIILRMIDPHDRSLFDKGLAEEKYREFQTNEIDDRLALSALKSAIEGRNVMVIGPGPSISDNMGKIKTIVEEKECVAISVSFIPSEIYCDYVFLSNRKRLDTTFQCNNNETRIIHTSNIKIADRESIEVNYSKLLNEDDIIIDNTSMMLLNLLVHLHPKSVFLAGLDGYSEDGANYYKDEIELTHNIVSKAEMNVAISNKISSLKSKLNIEFITPSKYENNGHM